MKGERILRQLDRLSPFAESIDVLILDGGSTDGSTDLDKLKQRGVRTLLVKTDLEN